MPPRIGRTLAIATPDKNVMATTNHRWWVSPRTSCRGAVHSAMLTMKVRYCGNLGATTVKAILPSTMPTEYAPRMTPMAGAAPYTFDTHNGTNTAEFATLNTLVRVTRSNIPNSNWSAHRCRKPSANA